jgi:hypothetical protein
MQILQMVLVYIILGVYVCIGLSIGIIISCNKKVRDGIDEFTDTMINAHRMNATAVKTVAYATMIILCVIAWAPISMIKK